MHVTKEFKWKHIFNCVIQNITDAPTLTSLLAIYIRDGIFQNLSFKNIFGENFARGTDLVAACLDVLVYMLKCVIC